MKKILIMGLPGAGKTYFAERLKSYLEAKAKVEWFNADEVRKKYDDWDFSREGRIRQSIRMSDLAGKSDSDFVVCDFIAPLPEMRSHYEADITIWIDTINTGRYEDTNNIFIPPDVYNFRITEQNAEKWVPLVGSFILENKVESNSSLQNKYHVRFNTKHNGSGLVWRVFENGIEHLATDVRIIGETYTECTEEYGETKWNISCRGRMLWIDKVAVIVAGKD